MSCEDFRESNDTGMKNKKHFVLVHGACHGAWCWYKILPLLKLKGHHVTALDLGASGINPKQLSELKSFSDYVQPLMEFISSLPQDESIILVGHSYGGLGLALAMEKFPEKISAAVFVTAYMPNFIDPPVTLVEEVKDLLLQSPSMCLHELMLVSFHVTDYFSLAFLASSSGEHHQNPF